MANSLPGRARSETSVRRSSASGRARTDAPVRLTERPPAAGCEPPLDAADLSRVRRPPPRPRSRFRKQEPQQAARSRQAARFPRPFDTSQAPNLVLAQNEFGMPLRKDQPRRHISIPQRPSAANPFALGLIFHDGSDEIDAACRAVSLKKDICFFDSSAVCATMRQLPRSVPRWSATRSRSVISAQYGRWLCQTARCRAAAFEIYIFYISSRDKRHRFYTPI